MDIKLSSIYSWSVGTNAKAKYFTTKKQNREASYNLTFALREIVDSNRDSIVAHITTAVTCNDNLNLDGNYYITLYFNSTGDTFYKMRWDFALSKYFGKLCKDRKEYYAVTQSLFEAIVATKEFQKFAQKATKNIQDCFKEVIEPLYKGELRVSDELDLDRDKEVVEEDRRKAIKNLMKLKEKIVSSSTLNLSHPEFKNTYVLSI